MEDKITVPYNDVFFYGVSLRSRDLSDVRGDIFSNIFMKYLRSLKPVTNRLYRSVENAKYEYNYVFVPSKPLSWRVIKNRRIIEDIEYLSDGKYCLNYYDDNGNDVKRVIYNNHHKWQKTNYYNTINGSNLYCYLVPKELNGQTVILQYITGEAYPVTLQCCPVPSSNEVLNNVLQRVPEPEVTALTNYGLLFFASDETYKLYKQVLDEEEKAYTEAHKPAVYNTQEDIEGGFCFDVSSFDSTKNVDSILDLTTADELTEEGFESKAEDVFEDIAADDSVSGIEQLSMDKKIDSIDVESEYSIDKEIADVIKVISEETKIEIDEQFVLSQVIEEPQNEENDNQTIAFENTDDINIFNTPSDVNLVSDIVLTDDPEIVIDDITDVNNVDIDNNVIVDMDEANGSDIVPGYFTDEVVADNINLLTLDDDAIDDYVSTLIDSLLLDAHSTAAEFMIDKGEVFTQAESEAASADYSVAMSITNDFVEDNTPDSVIESNGAKYYYYGETDDNNRRCGRGKTLMADGKTAYEGEYKDDMRHGTGSFYYKDGKLCYWGEWNENLRSGFGVGVSSETGVTHIGIWEQNKPEGIGVRFDKDGNFMYLDSACHRTNGGIRVTGFTDHSVFVEYWDENTLHIVKKELMIDDLLK